MMYVKSSINISHLILIRENMSAMRKFCLGIHKQLNPNSVCITRFAIQPQTSPQFLFIVTKFSVDIPNLFECENLTARIIYVFKFGVGDVVLVVRS